MPVEKRLQSAVLTPLRPRVPDLVRLRSLVVLIPLALAATAAPSLGRAETAAARRWLNDQGYAPPAAGNVVACHGYGCVRRTEMMLDPRFLGRAAALLRSGRSSAPAEREALAQIVGLYTARIAATIGGEPDAPRSPPGLSNVAGQMDCLDVTANVTSLLLVLEDRGLLARHHVERPQSRGVFFDGRWPHFSAVVVAEDGSRWVLDPWTRSPGDRPEVKLLEQWQGEG
jgi:hypothetical protein